MVRESLAETAYIKIREKIINATYMPGTLLSENELAEMLNMSRTPIRGAISRLESEGFVSSLRNRGIIVKEISYKDIMDILEVFLFLQEYAVGTVLEKGHSFISEELEMYLLKQLEAEGNNDYPEYIQNSLLFTRSMISASNNHMMLQIMDSVKDKLMQFSLVNWKLTPNTKHYSANLVNKSIYEAICAEDYHKIMQICRESYNKTRKRFINA